MSSGFFCAYKKFAFPRQLSYIQFMKIIWDEPKRRSNLTKHGLDFADLSIDFFAAAQIQSTKEGRYVAIGDLRGVAVIAVVFRPYGSEAISVISMRRANKAERNFS